MPWSVKKLDGKYCVVKEGETAPIKGGCHADRKEAVDHMQALYAAEAQYAVAESYVEDEEIALSEDDIEDFANLEFDDKWSGYIAFEGVPTGDNRSFSKESITWNTLPLPLQWQKTSSDGHSGSWTIGRVDTIERHEDGKVFATGVLLDTPEAQEYKHLLEAGAAGGVSIDGDTAEYSVEEAAEKGQKHKITFNSIRIRALTCVAIPAFADARIALSENTEVTLEDDDTEEFCDDITPGEEAEKMRKKRKKKASTWTYQSEEDALTAAAMILPPKEWFKNQNLPGPTPLTVLEDGQIFGHIALWGTCHIGMPACTQPPRGGSYAYFHTGALTTKEGDDVSVGHLTFNTGHAGLYDSPAVAASHYDHTGTVAADVVAGEDKYGIWVAGSMRPHLDDEQIRTFKSAPISGDWRRIGARMELVAALSVNTPGFPVPRTKVLVASGADSAFISVLENEDFEPFGRLAYKEDLVERVTDRLVASMQAKVELDAQAEEFNLSSLESALDHVEDAIEALEESDPDIETALSEARAAERTLKKAIKSYGGVYTRRLGPGPKGKAKGHYMTAETDEFNMKHTTSALDDVSDAIDALEEGDVSRALSNLEDAADALDDSIDSYKDDDDDILIRRRIILDTPPTTGMSADTVNFDADTEEFASCVSARRRVRKARRSLRKALTALRNCSGYRVVVVNPSPAPTGMSADAIEFDAETEEFFNQCHEPETGKFCEGEDGPGRLADNMKKVGETLPKGAPQYMKNLLSRRLGAARKKGEALLPKDAPAYMKELMARRQEEAAKKGPRSKADEIEADDAEFEAEEQKRHDEYFAQPEAKAQLNKVVERAKAKAAEEASEREANAMPIRQPSEVKTRPPAPAGRKKAPGYRAEGERKKESSGYHPASDYAYVPEGSDEKSSAWKLLLSSKPGGKPDAKHTAAAAQALSPEGYRGRPVQIPEKDRPAVVAKVRQAWLQAHPGKTEEDLPESLKPKGN